MDAPVDKGGKIFNDVLGKGFSVKFKIPGVDVDGSVDLPFNKMLPKIQIDLGGYVTISMGSELLQDEMKDNQLNWKNDEMEDLAKAQKDNEKTGFLSNQLSKLSVAYKYYRENKISFLMESKIKVGWFALLSGRWQVDNQDKDVKLTVIKLRGAFGLTLKYSFSWTMVISLGPVPVYIGFTVAITAGVAFGIQAGFSWVDGAFHDWQLQPAKDITFSLGFTFIVQGGLGVKDLLDVWVRFLASLNLRLTLVGMGDGRSEISGSYAIDFSVGVTLLFATFSKSFDSVAKPLFDPMNDNDLRFIGAVANAFDSFRPNDPRTEYLRNVFLDGQRRRRSANAQTDTVFAELATIIDIKLQDYNGKDHSLSQVATDNRVVLLDFTAYGAEFAPQMNKLLNDIYQNYHSRGLTIYQVSLDSDNVLWREAAKNLPWITVYDPMGPDSKNVGAYNVYGIPTTFIIRGGEIIERIEDPTLLKSAVSKLF